MVADPPNPPAEGGDTSTGTLHAGQLRRQLVAAAIITEPLVLGRVDLRGLLKHLAGELLVVTGRSLRRIGMHLRAIDNKHLNPGQPGLRAQRKDLTKQPGQRRLVTLTKARDRAVITPNAMSSMHVPGARFCPDT